MSWSRMMSMARAAFGIAHGGRAFGGPVQANLNLTNRCNVRCIHCYFHSPLIRTPHFFEVRRKGGALPKRAEDAARRQLRLQMDREMAATLIDRILALGTRRFQLSGNGELFTHPDALDLIARAKRGGAYCLCNTNGTLMDREVVDALIDMGFDDIRLSIMAGTRESFVRTHPGSPATQFDSLRDNLLYMAERKKVLGKALPKLSLSLVIVAQNADDLPAFTRLAKEVGSDCVIFRVFDDVGDPGYAPVSPTPEQSERVRCYLPEARRFLESHGIENNVDNVLQVFDPQLDTRALYRVIPCYYGWLTARIDADGHVYPCCRCYEPVGSVHEQDFADIWNGPAYRAFRCEAGTLHRRATSVTNCHCDRCVHHNANVRVYRLLHPVRGRSARLRNVTPGGGNAAGAEE